MRTGEQLLHRIVSIPSWTDGLTLPLPKSSTQFSPQLSLPKPSTRRSAHCMQASDSSHLGTGTAGINQGNHLSHLTTVSVSGPRVSFELVLL